MINEINAEWEKSDRLTVAKLNAVKQFNKQDYKSKLMAEKYSLLPLNPQQLTPVQTAIQGMSEKHPDFEIEPVNTIRPPEIEYTRTPQALVPIDTPLSIIHKHIPRQSDIDRIVRNIETRIIHSLELLIQAQDLVKAYQHSTHFHDIYQYITDEKLPSSIKAQNCIRAEALNYVVINHFLFRIDTQKDKDSDKGNSFLLVIPEKYEPIIFNTYHDSLLAGHQGPYHTAMTIRQKFFIHNLMNKVKRYIKACHTCLKTKPKYMKNRPIYGRIPVDYTPMQDLSIDIRTMPHAMYFTGNSDTVTKINQVPYQTIEYNENGMFTTKLMNDTPIEIFIDNGATTSILPLRTYNKFPILCTYPKTKSNTPIHTGGGLITSHFWLEIPLKLQHQTIQIKALVCDSECPYDLILGRISMAQLSAWQDYMTNKLYIQQISISLTVRNNIRIFPGKTGIVMLTL